MFSVELFNTSFKMSDFFLVDKVPPPSKRKKGAVYADTNMGAAERYEAIGKYMDQWNRLEYTAISLIHSILGGEYDAAHTIFASLLGLQKARDLITGLGRGKFSPAEQKKWNKISDNLTKLARTRNHIFHGEWQPDIFIYKEGEHIAVKHIEWRRVYSSADPLIRQKALFAKQEDGKDSFIFSLKDLHRKAADVSECADRVHSLKLMLMDRDSPLKQPRVYPAPLFSSVRLTVWGPGPKT